jgi:G3E family GTPase
VRARLVVARPPLLCSPVRRSGADFDTHAQVVFADIILMNKCDLIEEAEIVSVEAKCKAINASVEMIRTVNAEVPIEKIMGIGGFSLEKVLEMEPGFLDPDEEQCV